jgi:hypothetical protein
VVTEEVADDLIDQYHKKSKKAGDWWARLEDVERQKIETVYREIKDAELDLLTVWVEYRRLKKELRQTPSVASVPLSEAIAEFWRRKLGSGKSDRYVREVVDGLNHFGEGREKQLIAEIMPDEVDEWINSHKDWSLSTKRTQRGRFSSLWSVAVDKGWCSYNVVDRLDPINVLGTKVEIYANDTILHLFAAVMSNETTQQIIAPLVMEAFGCMRPEEVGGAKAKATSVSPFGWDDIDLQYARAKVRPEIAKVGDKRVIRLQPVCVEWLEVAKKLNNPLPPVNERRLVDQCCELIGLDQWIRDGLRKCCATHLRWVYKNDYHVVKDMGNSVRIMLRHYADLHTPDFVSQAYWKITPKKVEEFMKTDAWKNLLIEASAKRPAPKPSENARPAH